MIEQLAAPARAVGGFFEMALDTFTKMWRRPFQFREFFEQTWMIARVSLVPTLLVAIPFTVLVAFTLNILLREIGAADLSGAGTAFGTVTQLGPVVTVLVVAGAGATAICADLGARTIREEIDAMRTIGVSPMEALVIPRMLAAIVMMPLLGFFSTVVSIIGGGMFCWISLEMPPITFVQRLQEVIPITDLWVGLLKAPVFGAIIAMTGCFQGMLVEGNAEQVGLRTTSAVVQAIFLVIVLDAFFAVFFSQIGWI